MTRRNHAREPHRAEYRRRFGAPPRWLARLGIEDARRLLEVALRVGMRLADRDHHLIEDSTRPDLAVPRRPPGAGPGTP